MTTRRAAEGYGLPGSEFSYAQERQMRRTILIFGVISGVVSSVLMVATTMVADRIGIDKGAIVGYTGIVLSFLLVFFGIRSYRDNVEHGQITFSKAFGIGMGITVISCVFYVVTWEVIYYNFLPHFWDNYGKDVAAKLQASGASAATVQTQMEQVKKYKELYANPLINAAMTFIEPFPVGLVITLVSAGVLRRKPRSQTAPVTA
jgi:hypothetical protein